MAPLVNLRNRNADPDPDVVEALEESLELAKTGELRSIYLVGNMTGHRTHTNFSTHDLLEGIGMLSFLLHKLNARLGSNREGP